MGVTFHPSYLINHLPSHPTPKPPPHPCWHQLGPARGDPCHHLQVPYPIPYHIPCPIWFPNSSNSAIAKLQSLQNSALHTIMGCVKMASIDHLHAETQILPVHSHLSLLCSQFLARTLIPSHNIRNTLQSRFLPSVSTYLINGTLPPNTYKQTIQSLSLHTQAVSTSINSHSPNPVLQSSPPPINPDEQTLPRPY